MMDIAKIIGANITALMANTPGLTTCKKVAAKSGVGFGTVQRAKNGEINITIEKLTKIAAIFHRHPAELMIDWQNMDERPPLPDFAQCIPGGAPPVAQERAGYAEVLAFPRPLLDELQALAATINDQGLNRLIERAHQMAEQFPRADEGNAAQ